MTTTRLLGPALAAVVLVIVAFVRRRLGPNADWVETLRACALPPLDPVLQRYFGSPGSAYRLGPEEHAASEDAPPEEVERHLWDLGARRTLLAASKTAGDRVEAGSWAYRESPVPPRKQVHVMLFEREGGGTDIYAHQEFSSEIGWLWKNPEVLYRHYNGHGYSPEDGEAFVRGLLLRRLQKESLN